MVEISEIKDRKTFETWLKQTDLPREVLITLAHRAAMRVAPLYWNKATSTPQKLHLTDLRVQRCNLTSGVAVITPTPEIRIAASAASASASASSDVTFALASAAASSDGLLSSAAFDASPDAAATSDSAAAVFASCFSSDGSDAALAFAAAASSAAAAAAAASSASDAASFAAVSFAFSAAAFAAGDRSLALAVSSAAAWAALRDDCTLAFQPEKLQTAPLWPAEIPLESAWQSGRRAWAAAGEDGQFWIDWYEGALAGKPLDPKLLEEVARIPAKDWDQGSDHVNALIADIVERSPTFPPPISQAAVTDFTFEAMLQQMRAVGFNDDAAHLRDPETIQRFLDDIEELTDSLTDFSDFAAEVKGQTNAPIVLVTASDKVLLELKRTSDKNHLRARRLVTLGGYIEGLSNEESKRAEIKETLAKMLDESVALMKAICRKHFAPSMVVMQALDGLELGDVDPEELIALLEKAIVQVADADGKNLVPLRPEDLSMLRDMVQELRIIDASIDEARTDKFKELQQGRFARSAGAATATLGRFIEKSAPHAEDAGKKFDKSVKWFNRVKTLQDAWEWLDGVFGSGGPPVG